MADGFWPRIATEITEAGRFIEADAEDQDSFQRYPGSSQFLRAGLTAAAG